MSLDTYIHKAAAGEPGGPLLFVFHGTGADENQFLGFAREMMPAATVISPRGDVSEHGAARFFRRTGEGVYDMADLERATAKMVGFIEAHVAQSKSSAILGFGYSNGANILASVIFARPHLFTAAALMHPLIPFEPKIEDTLSGRRVLITAGRRDPICPAPLTEALAARLESAGADVDLAWHDGGHEIRQGEIVALEAFLAPYRQPA